MSKQKVVICGGGNASHIFFGLASSNPNNEAYLLSTFGDEAARFKKEVTSNNNIIDIDFVLQKKVRSCKVNPNNITNNAELALTNANVIIISLPAFAHNGYLTAIHKYVKPNNNNRVKPLIALFPGASGLECEYSNIFGNNNKDFVLISCITLPWAARIKTFGKYVEALGIKTQVEISFKMYKEKRELKSNILNKLDEIIEMVTKQDYIDILGNIIHYDKCCNNEPKLNDYGHLLNMSLGAVNAMAHPSIMYGYWNNIWDKKPLNEKPLFYHGLTKNQAKIMIGISEECMKVVKAIKKKTNVKSLHIDRIDEWYFKTYGNICKDSSNLYTMINTNPSYKGLTHPCIQNKDGKWMPNFKYRYMTEDIPMGLVVIRGIGYIVDKNIDMSTIDTIIIWAQKVMNKEYFKYKDGKLDEPNFVGKDINQSRAPQRYNQSSIFEII